MKKIEDRIKELNQYEYFNNKIGLAEELAKVENKTRIKIPNKFKEVTMPEYEYGKIKIKIGTIDKYFYIEVKNEKTYYKVFENKIEFKKFFTMNDLEKEVIAYFLKEIEEIPIFL